VWAEEEKSPRLFRRYRVVHSQGCHPVGLGPGLPRRVFGVSLGFQAAMASVLDVPQLSNNNPISLLPTSPLLNAPRLPRFFLKARERKGSP
jgi:hypothetical protein